MPYRKELKEQPFGVQKEKNKIFWHEKSIKKHNMDLSTVKVYNDERIYYGLNKFNGMIKHGKEVSNETTRISRLNTLSDGTPIGQQGSVFSDIALLAKQNDGFNNLLKVFNKLLPKSAEEELRIENYLNDRINTLLTPYNALTIGKLQDIIEKDPNLPKDFVAKLDDYLKQSKVIDLSTNYKASELLKVIEQVSQIYAEEKGVKLEPKIAGPVEPLDVVLEELQNKLVRAMNDIDEEKFSEADATKLIDTIKTKYNEIVLNKGGKTESAIEDIITKFENDKKQITSSSLADLEEEIVNFTSSGSSLTPSASLAVEETIVNINKDPEYIKSIPNIETTIKVILDINAKTLGSKVDVEDKWKSVIALVLFRENEKTPTQDEIDEIYSATPTHSRQNVARAFKKKKGYNLDNKTLQRIKS